MLWLAGTPIGNLGDASSRLREMLERADLIAAEDTRRTARLLRLLSIEHRPELIALHDHNERDRAAEIVARATHEEVLLVSDAGMPTVSDPGFQVVRLALAHGVSVSVVPGPSAVTAALAVAGLPTDRFAFEGFLPRKPGERARALAELAYEPRTLVFFEAPSRIADMLAALVDAFGGQRAAAVCRELTKQYEEVRRGPLHELAAWAEGGVRGELVVVVAGAQPQQVSLPTGCAEVLARVRAGERVKDACRAVAEVTGLATKDLYAAALAARDQQALPASSDVR